jgi:hypothetical protein
VTESTLKICKGCALALPLSSFNQHTTMKDGLRSKCIECRRLEHIQYRQSNPEKIRALQKKLDEKKRSRPEYISQKKIAQRAYNSTEAGRAKNNLRAARWRQNNLLKLVVRTEAKRRVRCNSSKSMRDWRIRNKDKANANYALRRARKKKATPDWLAKADKEQILELYTICQMFKVYTGQDYHVDHVVPLVHPIVCGLHIPCNLRVIPAKENLSKNNKFCESIAIDWTAEAYC